ncbi:hypothetical protein CNY89_16955 [Amaricoccus sp. HAR-UPW-R2A-40]|nr:hypothetical protein CNY89_16955 [Amaricoccus sp. HAR-UPW-R2A-40]
MADSNDRLEPSPRPGKATAEQGVVLLDCPRGAVVTLTPEAAEATSESLRRAAALAEDQRNAARVTEDMNLRRLRPDPPSSPSDADG